MESIGIAFELVGLVTIICLISKGIKWAMQNIHHSYTVLSVLFGLSVFTNYWLARYIDSKSDKTEITTKPTGDYSYLYTEEVSDSLMYLVCNYYGVTDAKYVIAQAHLESGHFTSTNFVEKNNFLGLYDSKNKCYFSFDSWQDCIEGYVKYVQKKKKDGEEHLSFLKRIGYAEDPNYINKVMTIYNRIL